MEDYLTEADIAYVMGRDVPFHVQLIYMADMMHYWKIRKFCSSQGLIDWCGRNWMHFTDRKDGKETEHSAFVKMVKDKF